MSIANRRARASTVRQELRVQLARQAPEYSPAQKPGSELTVWRLPALRPVRLDLAWFHLQMNRPPLGAAVRNCDLVNSSN